MLVYCMSFGPAVVWVMGTPCTTPVCSILLHPVRILMYIKMINRPFLIIISVYHKKWTLIMGLQPAHLFLIIKKIFTNGLQKWVLSKHTCFDLFNWMYFRHNMFDELFSTWDLRMRSTFPEQLPKCSVAEVTQIYSMLLKRKLPGFNSK